MRSCTRFRSTIPFANVSSSTHSDVLAAYCQIRRAAPTAMTAIASTTTRRAGVVVSGPLWLERAIGSPVNNSLGNADHTHRQKAVWAVDRKEIGVAAVAADPANTARRR